MEKTTENILVGLYPEWTIVSWYNLADRHDDWSTIDKQNNSYGITYKEQLAL
ncbi:hypothetical protein LPB86_18535 [Pedobacter sp. MC2016-14]|uniref:hypothetical protein n=1 Tax=Pedobacter sp. MC2016-14 TaxID=2897327 RepID=UPI001E3A7A50|nr:hypothetical protein [Pedobacter sp. MC2016-14]MCD0490245.1 hypothetical protein [Pedobacter sp. MC2016-14]